MIELSYRHRPVSSYSGMMISLYCQSWMPAFAGMTWVGHDRIVIPAQAGIQGKWQRIEMERQPCVYILASKRNGTLYTGVTSSLVKRIWEHKTDLVEGFTKNHGVHTLVWYEIHDTMESAIQREKAIKNWKRAWKIKIIEQMNKKWSDLYPDLL